MIFTATNIVKQYPRSKFQLQVPNITLSEGAIVGVVGENGNGKTTLLNILDGEVGAQILLALFGGAVVYVAFIGNFKPKLKRIFGISLNIMLPILVPIIISFEMLDEDEFFVFAFVIGLITTYIFSFYYRYQYLHPKKS